MLNVEATATAIAELTGHVFDNKLLCAEAVQMAAPQTEILYNGSRGLANNKHLAILGDAILSKVLCATWYRARGSSGNAHSASRWTRLRNDLLSNDGLAERGYRLGIDEIIFVADGTYHKSPKMVATTLEAIVGAVFEDGGDEAVLRVITRFGFLEHGFLTVTLKISYCGSRGVLMPFRVVFRWRWKGVESDAWLWLTRSLFTTVSFGHSRDWTPFHLQDALRGWESTQCGDHKS